ncbi:MAG: ABC transporter permease [Planctomycetaceae bacterium]|jgi:ABC-2 type transport system permease protein|nr:ABC transporter permease [Planctomycetaceae bacterium]
MLIRLYHLIIKELLISIRDPQSRLALIVPPLLQIFILSFTITLEVKNAPFGVYNKDFGIEGYSLIKRFEHSPLVSKIVTVSSQNEIEPLLDRQKVLGIIVIPQDFSKQLYSRQTVQVQILLDGRRTNAAQIAGGYATKIVNSFVGEFAENQTGIAVVTRNWFNVNLDPLKTTVPSLVCVLATILGVLIASLSIARERETGTFEQLLISPLTPFEILVGKAIPAVFLATCSAVMMIGIVIFILNIPLRGSFWLLILSMDLFLFSAVGAGLFISSLSMTQQQATLGVILVLPASIMLSGFVTPVENMPQWMQQITIINPVRWYLVIVKGIFMKGMEPSEVALNCIPLVILAVVTLSAAAVMFKRRME